MQDKIYRRNAQSGGVPKKKKDKKARKRNTIMNFRVSPLEKQLIDKRIELSGLSKSEYFIQSCMYQAVFVKGNIKTFDVIKASLADAGSDRRTTERTFAGEGDKLRAAGDDIKAFIAGLEAKERGAEEKRDKTSFV